MKNYYNSVFKVRTLFVFLCFLVVSFTSFSQTCNTYNSSPSFSIPNNTSTFSDITIAVSDDVLITDVNIILDITHTYNSDIDVFLVHPDGTEVELATDRGGNANGFINAEFDDSSSNILEANPYTGNYLLDTDFQPEDQAGLIRFNNRFSAGNWLLRTWYKLR